LILVDSSVWIDYFCGVMSPQTDYLDLRLGNQPVAIGDIIMTEVLQGFSTQHDFDQALILMSALEVINIGGQHIAVKAANNFRTLRAKGITVRKTVDTLIATRCIDDGLTLLHCDRDFDPFVTYLSLKSVF
jgi:predicted nucleic acid-binding protein